MLTVASWNEQEATAKGGSADARLNLHRPQPDWAGGDHSPWDQLRHDLKRPLWVVSDESHNQSTVQLDQLAALGPQGFFMASATPVVNDLFVKWTEALQAEEATKALLAAGQVPVRTRDVVDADLLKTTIELIDYRSGTEESLDGALNALEQVRAAAAAEGTSVAPRAIYVVERSNPPRGSLEDPRPVVIWRHLRQRGVPAEEIAVFTDTRELPEDAERVTHLSQLAPRYRHIIFNQSLQEGWDDPEAYVCYFDGATKSFTRIRQIVGRVLRQPAARRFGHEELNTATLILQTPAESYERVVTELRAELRLYAPPDEPGFTPVRLKTRKEPLPPIAIKPELAGKLSLPRRTLRAPSMRKIERDLATTGERPWPQDALDAPGHRPPRRRLAGDRRRGPHRHRCSAQRPHAQRRLPAPAHPAAQPRVRERHPPRPLPRPGLRAGQLLRLAGAGQPHRPRRRRSSTTSRTASPTRRTRTRCAHAGSSATTSRAPASCSTSNAPRTRSTPRPTSTPTSSSSRARSIASRARPGSATRPTRAAATGSRCRARSATPPPSTPTSCSGSATDCWAIDTTGPHLLDAKVQGKLLTLQTPKLALAVRGTVDLGSGSRKGKEGWSLVLPREHLQPIVEHGDDLDALLRHLAGAAATTT